MQQYQCWISEFPLMVKRASLFLKILRMIAKFNLFRETIHLLRLQIKNLRGALIERVGCVLYKGLFHLNYHTNFKDEEDLVRFLSSLFFIYLIKHKIQIS